MGPGRGASKLSLDEANKVVEYLGENADRNRPWGNRVVIHKTDSETGQAIAAEAQFTLYEWNAARGVYEGQHQLCDRAGRGRQLHRRLPAPGAGAGRSRAALLEDTLCDTRADTANHDGTTSRHEVFCSDARAGKLSQRPCIYQRRPVPHC